LLAVRCRDDFDPETFENKAALGLLQRFVTNGREVDGSPTRDRLKMIVRCVQLHHRRHQQQHDHVGFAGDFAADKLHTLVLSWPAV
jgi:hypothetical protein